MGIKKYNPITPTMRYKTGFTFEEITQKGIKKMKIADKYLK